MKPVGSADALGRCRSEGFCDLCGDRVWWCADPPGPYLVLPFNDDGGKHWKTCELGLKIEDKMERIYRMVSERALEEYRHGLWEHGSKEKGRGSEARPVST